MIIFDVGLGEGRIDEIVGRRIDLLQKILCVKLIIGLQAINFGILQRQRPDIFGKSPLVVVPEHELAGFPRKLCIQAIGDLL